MARKDNKRRYSTNRSSSSGESYYSNTGLGLNHPESRISRSTVEDRVKEAPPKPIKKQTYPKKWRDNPQLPTKNSGETLSIPVLNSGPWQPKTSPGPARARYPSDKDLSKIDEVYHNPQLGFDNATNMSLGTYHSKSKGEPGLKSNGQVNLKEPRQTNKKQKVDDDDDDDNDDDDDDDEE